MRRKRKAKSKPSSMDFKLEEFIKNRSYKNVDSIVEVMMHKDDGSVYHFKKPQVLFVPNSFIVKGKPVLGKDSNKTESLQLPKPKETPKSDRYLLKDEEVAKKILATMLGPQSQFRKDNPKLGGILQNLIAKDVGSSVIELWLRNDKSDKLLHESIARHGSYEILRAIAVKCWRAVREQKPQSYTAHLAAALKATFPKRTFPDLSALHISFEYVVISILRKSMLTDDIPDNEMGQFKILKKDYLRVGTCLTDNKFYAFREKYISGASAFPPLPQVPPDTTLYYHFKYNAGENTIPGVLKSGLRAPRVQNYDDRFDEHLDFGSGFYTTTNPAEIMILVGVYEMGVVLVFAVPNNSGLTRYIWEGNEWVDCVKRYLTHNPPYPTKPHDLWEGAVSHNHHYVYQQDEDPVPSEKYQVVVKTAHGAQVFNNSLFAIIEWD